MSDLDGIAPGSWCPAYHKTADRTTCNDRKCKYFQTHVITIGNHLSTPQDDVPDFDDDLNAISVKKPVIMHRRINYVIGEPCVAHCCRFDEPSQLESLPWI